MKNIAILTGSGGQGHISTAKALESWLKVWGCKSQVFEVLPKINDRVYQILAKSPKSYRSLFKLTDKLPIANLYLEATKHDLERRLEKAGCDLDSFDCVISTHPFIHPICRSKTIMLLLDPLLHTAYFAKPRASKYLSFWERDIQKGVRMGIEKSSILISNPIVRSSFYQKAVTPSENIILVTAGGNWINKSAKYIEHILNVFNGENLQFVFVCGKNKSFYEKKSKQYARHSQIRFVDWQNEKEMANLISRCLAVLAFSVAQMSVEAGVCGKPIFIAEYILGQEEGFVEELTKKGVAQLLYGLPSEKIALLKVFLLKANPISKLSLKEWRRELLLAPGVVKRHLS
jgi:UDP-N-acetylglucosamine:LPS N-acetylglucosamine transferase